MCECGYCVLEEEVCACACVCVRVCVSGWEVESVFNDEEVDGGSVCWATMSEDRYPGTPPSLKHKERVSGDGGIILDRKLSESNS